MHTNQSAQRMHTLSCMHCITLAPHRTAPLPPDFHDLYILHKDPAGSGYAGNYTDCAIQTGGLHFFTNAPKPSGQQVPVGCAWRMMAHRFS
jgi:hypothetical protein